MARSAHRVDHADQYSTEDLLLDHRALFSKDIDG
jgi:hypothetical protein